MTANSTSPFFSICVPTYQRCPLLQQAVKSILDQNDNSFEIVISDNGSNDGTAQWVTSLNDPRITFTRYDSNQGPTVNVLNTLSHASGRFVMFLSDDDLLEPGTLQRLQDIIRSHPSVGLIMSSFQLMGPSSAVTTGVVDRFFVDRLFLAGDQALAALFTHTHVISGITLRRDLVNVEGVMDFKDSLYPQSLICGRVLRDADAYYVREPLFRHRVNNPTFWSYSADFMAGDLLRMIHAITDDRPELAPTARTLIRQRIRGAMSSLQLQRQRSWSDFTKTVRAYLRIEAFRKSWRFHGMIAYVALLGPWHSSSHLTRWFRQPTLSFSSLHERTKLVVRGMAGIMLMRPVNVLAGYVLVSITVRHLNKTDYGLWAIVMSVVGWVALLDFGLGNSLRNKIAELGPQRHEESRTLFFSGISFYSYLVLFCFLIWIPLHFYIIRVQPAWTYAGVPWHSFYEPASIALLFTLASVPLALSGAVLYAEQRAHINALFATATQCLSVVTIYLLTHLQATLVTLTWGYFATVFAVSAFKMTYVINERHWIPRLYSLPSAFRLWTPLLGQSIQFGLLKTSSTVLFSSGPLIVGLVTSAGDAGEFSLVQKLFFSLISLHSMVLVPFWSAYTEGVSRNDWLWVKRYFSRTTWATIGFYAAGSLALIFAFDPLMVWWTGQRIETPMLVATIAVWSVLYGLINAAGTFLNGIGVIRLEVGLITGAALLNLPLGFWFGRYGGAPGVLWGSILLLVPVLFLLYRQCFTVLQNRACRQASH